MSKETVNSEIFNESVLQFKKIEELEWKRNEFKKARLECYSREKGNNSF